MPKMAYFFGIGQHFNTKFLMLPGLTGITSWNWYLDWVNKHEITFPWYVEISSLKGRNLQNTVATESSNKWLLIWSLSRISCHYQIIRSLAVTVFTDKVLQLQRCEFCTSRRKQRKKAAVYHKRWSTTQMSTSYSLPELASSLFCCRKEENYRRWWNSTLKHLPNLTAG